MTALFYATINETRKGLIILWDYKVSVLIQLISIFIVVVGVMFFVGNGQITETQVASTLLGFIITYYAMEAISNMSWALMNEAQSGTLEQMYMSLAPSQLIILGRSFASLISATVQMLLVVVVTTLLFNTRLPLSLDIIPILLISLIGLIGFGYIVGGITLVFKQVGPLANILTNLLLFINGTFVAVELMPAWMGTIATLVPSTLGIILLRRIALDGDTLAMVWADGSLPWLIIHSLVFFVLGWLIYTICERIARQQGTLGQY
jgi:ABC-2 type transport system permease protein